MKADASVGSPIGGGTESKQLRDLRLSSILAESSPNDSCPKDVHEACMAAAPKAFVSYSHDSSAHKSWVLAFVSRLCHGGIDAVLDQWDLTPGADLNMFM